MESNLQKNNLKKPIKILVLEPDRELQKLYKLYFDIISLPISCLIVGDDTDNSKEFLNSVNRYYTYGNSFFDIVIVDTHINKIGGINIAKEILEINHVKKIIITTTFDPEMMDEMIESIGLGQSVTILRKPFLFSDLLSLINLVPDRVDKVKLKDHVLAAYDTIDVELKEAAQFIKKGLVNNEMNLLLIRKDMNIDEVISNLRSSGLSNINFNIKDQNIMIIKNEEWYLSDGKADKDKIIKQWKNLANRSVNIGKKGLRAFCMMDCFFENGFVKEVVDYESTLPANFEIPFVPICAYRQKDLDCLSDIEKKRLVNCHSHLWIG